MPFPLSTQVSLQVSLQKLIAYGIVHFVYEQVVYSLQHHWWLVWEGGGGVTVGSSLSLLLQIKHTKKKEVEVGNDPYTQRLVHVTSSS